MADDQNPEFPKRVSSFYSSSSSDEEEEEEELEYCANTPWFKEVQYDHDTNFPPYKPIFLDEPEFHFLGPSFELPPGIQPTAEVMSQMFLPDHLLQKWVDATNANIALHVAQKPRTTTMTDLLRFLAAIQYMGLVHLSCKEDYFFPNEFSDVLPLHPSIKINKNTFLYLWRWFHTDRSSVSNIDDDDAAAIDDDEDEDHEENEEEEDENEIEEHDDNIDFEDSQPDWFHQVNDFINHIHKVIRKVCKHPGSIVSIDEMLRKFKGRSAQTYRMKRKPDKEGYKFFCLCGSSGFVYSFFPDGRLVKNTILQCVTKLVDSLPRKAQVKYHLAMDNYFTQPAVIEMCRSKYVGVIGTARRQRNWPPREYKRIDDKRFNTAYLMEDKRNFLMMRWVDNDVVDMVTTIHDGYSTVLKLRKRPRENPLNRHNVRQVWGDNWGANIDIPEMVDNYNCWMGGVDKAYQLISYYKPRLRCRRTWLPLFLHCMDICVLNSYIISKHKNVASTHKRFVMDWIKALNTRADIHDKQATRKALAVLLSPPTYRDPAKRIRMSHKKPKLPDYRLQGDPQSHLLVSSATRGGCIYCKYQNAIGRLENKSVKRIPRRNKKCILCGDYLCPDCFEPFHAEE